MKNKLSKAQQRIVNDLRNCEGSFIQLNVTRHEYSDYAFAEPAEGLRTIMKNGVMIRVEGLFEMYNLPYHKAQETIECLIRKKVLITTMTDKEFAIQLALGTIDYRMYNLAEEHK